ncbi:uncharacterized protein [Nicotiana sylvestris]|uniref:uncharacterized protein n=1 Tax=Nicotiana sylvestris TaxID=4096 RepID=UPI00388CA164
MLIRRIGSELFDDPMGDLKDLRQVSSVQDYVDLFDELLTRVELSEEYVVSCFIRGLKPEIGFPVKMLAPRTLAKAISLAKIQEQTLVVQKQVFMTTTVPSYSTKNLQKLLSNFQFSQPYAPTKFTQPSNKTPHNHTPSLKPTYRNAKRLTPAEMEERRSKGLCYNCDEKYSFGHVCKNKRQLFSMKAEEGIEEVELEEEVMFDPAQLLTMIGQGLETDAEGSILPHVSVHAINGLHDFRTMRVAVSVKGKAVQVLIDTGSTHNFLDLNIVKKLGCVLTSISPFDVSVADGKRMQSNYICKKLVWKMQGVSFDSDMLVLPIGDCSMVLGIQWLITLGDIMWNFKKLRMEFSIMGHKVSLREIQPPATKMIPHTSMNKLLAKPAKLCMSFFTLWGYSWKVSNKEWRELNSCTVKDKFPIPVIKELLDELHGAKYFSKLDLRSGYHQIRMFEPDIPKTAFRTHYDHYEFLVMPFGLTNAPSIFQSLMNQIFHDYLRKFILVFFDDILIYNQNWEDHLLHLEEAFKVLRIHTLYIKQSKCAFGVTQIDYVGHIISEHGVAMDQHKVQGVLDWPLPTSIKGIKGFLGLIGYYRRFIKGYGIIVRPLNDLLKKGNFQWNPTTTTAFQDLKLAITSALVLALPDFSKEFTVETDASGGGIRAVLAQDNKPIAFFSKGLSDKNKALYVYERELLALVFAVQKWRPYLLGPSSSKPTITVSNTYWSKELPLPVNRSG